MKLRLSLVIAVSAALCTLTTEVSAQPAPPAGATQAQERVGADRRPAATLRLYPGVAPGSETWNQSERTTVGATGDRLIRNVVTPTLEVYLPDPAKATGAGVVVAPGGAMRFLSYDNEGVWVAQWLAEHGIAAFVLKYRTLEMAADDAAFQRQLMEMFQQLAKTPPSAGVTGLQGTQVAVADGVRGLQLAREKAGEWGVDPDRIGFMGFSAGARVTVGVVSEGAGPAFAAPIYGGAFGDAVNVKDAPPMFLALSADDTLVMATTMSLFQQLQAANRPVELHVYQDGGHGWGLTAIATKGTRAHWLDEFYWWLEANGWLKRR